MLLPRDTSGCSCIFVVLPPPSDAVPACRCVWTPVMRAAVCLLYVSAVKCRRVAGLRVCHSQHSLAVCSRCVVVVRRALVCTCTVSLSSRCDVCDRRSVAASSSGMTVSGTCGAVWLCRFGSHSHTVLCVSDTSSMQCANWLSFDLI